jgi:hypothetical protein
METERIRVGISSMNKAVSYLRRLVAGFSLRRLEFEPESNYAGSMVDRAILGKVF